MAKKKVAAAVSRIEPVISAASRNLAPQKSTASKRPAVLLGSLSPASKPAPVAAPVPQPVPVAPPPPLPAQVEASTAPTGEASPLPAMVAPAPEPAVPVAIKKPQLSSAAQRQARKPSRLATMQMPASNIRY